jgi:hypothetical protein
MPEIAEARKSISRSARTLRNRARRDDWKKNYSKQPATKDEILKAYLQGVEKGLNDIQQTLLEKMSEYVSRLAADRDRIAESLTSNGFHPTKAFLRINQWNNFKLLILVPKEDFLKESFLSIYDLTYQIEEEYEGTNARLDIGFMNGALTEEDEKRLASDGYYHDWEFLNGDKTRKP